MFQEKVILVIDEVGEKQCGFAQKAIESRGYRPRIVKLFGYFTGNPIEDFYRFAAECGVSPDKLDTDYLAAKNSGITYGTEGVDMRDISLEEFCWQYVVQVLLRDIGSLDGISHVIGTDQRAVDYLVQHLRDAFAVSGTVATKSD